MEYSFKYIGGFHIVESADMHFIIVGDGLEQLSALAVGEAKAYIIEDIIVA